MFHIASNSSWATVIHYHSLVAHVYLSGKLAHQSASISIDLPKLKHSQPSYIACRCGDSLLNMVMSPVGHEEQQGDDRSDGGNQRDQGGRGPQAVLTRSRAK